MTVACPEQVRPEIPRKALRDGTQGVVKAQAVIRDGVVKEVTILSGPHVYHAPVREAMLQYKCVGDGEVIATQEFVFKID
jgi:protein TonB